MRGALAKAAMNSIQSTDTCNNTCNNRRLFMSSRLALIACTALSIGSVLPAAAEEVGVGIGPAGAGVTVRGDRDHDRDKTIIVNPDRDRAERDKTVIINKDRDR
ncbi:MAG: hypothetical protein WBL84_02595 [Xanthobacteraceae bacterium]